MKAITDCAGSVFGSGAPFHGQLAAARTLCNGLRGDVSSIFGGKRQPFTDFLASAGFTAASVGISGASSSEVAPQGEDLDGHALAREGLHRLRGGPR